MLKLRWMKNSAGEPDAMLTCAVVSFFVTSLCVVASMLKSVSLGGVNVALQTPDVTLLLGYLGACFTSYVVRRNKKDQFQSDKEKIEMENGILGE